MNERSAAPVRAPRATIRDGLALLRTLGGRARELPPASLFPEGTDVTQWLISRSTFEGKPNLDFSLVTADGEAHHRAGISFPAEQGGTRVKLDILRSDP